MDYVPYRLPLVQVIWFLKISLGFRYYPSVDEIITDEDGEEINAYPVSDYSLVPDSYVPFQIMMNDVKNVIMHLPYTQRNMFLESTGVCEICWKKPKGKPTRRLPMSMNCSVNRQSATIAGEWQRIFTKRWLHSVMIPRA